jgi:hypothetical protein
MPDITRTSGSEGGFSRVDETIEYPASTTFARVTFWKPRRIFAFVLAGRTITEFD